MPLPSLGFKNQNRGNSGGATNDLLAWITRLPFLLVVFVVILSNPFGIQAFPIAGDLGHHHNNKGSKFGAVHPIRSEMNPSTTVLFSTARSTTATTSFRDHLDDRIREGIIDEDLASVLLGIAKSCVEVSRLLKSHTLDQSNHEVVTAVNVQGEQQKGMDVVANDVFVQTLKSVDAVVAMASEEEEAVIYTSNEKSNRAGYEIAFDPLDGSGNLDVNLPTGSIFGIATSHENAFSRSGSDLVASGYALYSSSTELIVSLGIHQPVVGFTLLSDNEFVLSRNNIRCPAHGPYYSLNEAREPDWPEGLRRWIHDAKRGHTTTQKTYSSRYVCSLCADFHRTLLQGGWAGNPRPHLRLLYEAAPLAFLIESAGGKGSDGTQSLLEILPQGLHDRVCVFLGSKDDIDDLESYGDVQQVQSKRYEA